jgi:general secretion pathway protein A
MSRSQFESPPPSSFSSVVEPLPFHNNLHYQEVLAKLRYGIIARKGLILLIGDAGVGKTTMLDQLARELDTSVTCIFEPDPEVNFTDLLRLILSNLENPGNSDNSLSMMQRCKVILRSELEQGRIVSLMIDNAERLRDESLEYLLHNFYRAAPAERDQNLLQIVLAGRPELGEKPRLRSLKIRSEFVCQLQPLRDKDIAAYLKTRLRAAHLPEETFDSAAIDRIAAYTGGNPHLINAISNRALQVSDQSSVANVTAEMVARAAHGLNLSETRRPLGEAVKQNFEILNERDESFPFNHTESDTTEVVGQTFLNYTFDDPRTAGRKRKTIRVLLILLLLGGGAAWLQSEAGKAQLSNWIGTQDGNVDLQSDANLPTIAKQDLPVPGAPSREIPSPPISDSATDSPPLADAEKSAEIPSPILTEKATEKSAASGRKPAPRKTPVLASKDRQAPVADNPNAQRKLLQAKIYKAIANRAIIGVTVSVIDNITYLDGRVATESQRNAAEQAARSVAGVERVRNRIAVPVS